MLHMPAAAVEGRDNQSHHSIKPLILITSFFHNRGEIDWSLDYSGNPASSRKLSCRTLVPTLYSRVFLLHIVINIVTSMNLKRRTDLQCRLLASLEWQCGRRPRWTLRSRRQPRLSPVGTTVLKSCLVVPAGDGPRAATPATRWPTPCARTKTSGSDRNFLPFWLCAREFGGTWPYCSLSE